MAELASAFLVISQANSRVTGRIVSEQTPMMVITTKIPASKTCQCSHSLENDEKNHSPTQISVNHIMPKIGETTLANKERWYLKTRSKRGLLFGGEYGFKSKSLEDNLRRSGWWEWRKKMC